MIAIVKILHTHGAADPWRCPVWVKFRYIGGRVSLGYIIAVDETISWPSMRFLSDSAPWTIAIELPLPWSGAVWCLNSKTAHFPPNTCLPSVNSHTRFPTGCAAKKVAKPSLRRSYCLRANLHHLAEMISAIKLSANLSAPSPLRSYTAS